MSDFPELEAILDRILDSIDAPEVEIVDPGFRREDGDLLGPIYPAAKIFLSQETIPTTFNGKINLVKERVDVHEITVDMFLTLIVFEGEIILAPWLRVYDESSGCDSADLLPTCIKRPIPLGTPEFSDLLKTEFGRFGVEYEPSDETRAIIRKMKRIDPLDN